MDDKLFKQKLTEVAEWRIPKTVTGTISGDAKRPRKPGRPTKEELYQDEHEQVFLEMFDGTNPTFPPQITQVKRTACECADCGRTCPNGRETEAKLHQKNGKKAWRQKCVTCGMFQNPFNGKFELQGSAASIKFNDFMRETKGAYNTQGNQQRQRVMLTKTILESDQETITFYHDENKET